MTSTFDREILPRWDDPALKAGTKIRTALWLLGEIGVGNVFTKEQHRQAFPGIAQADRRLRDLRPFGWIIHTNLEDVTLNSSEQRFVTAGLPIWKPSARDGHGLPTLTAKKRREIFAGAGYQCTVCGIAGGESYPDSPWMSATLSIAKRIRTSPDGRSEQRFAVECKRCQSGSDSRSEDLAGLVSLISSLSADDRMAILHLAAQPPGSALLKAWAVYRDLPADARLEIRSWMSKNCAES
jgi:hypothetical protein